MMFHLGQICRCTYRARKLIFGIGIPLIFLILPLTIPTKEAKCAYILCVMAAYWVLEPIPLAATALMPVALFPMLGILSTSAACSPYMKSANMMFLGGLFMAIAIENCNLHRRIALRVLLCVGTSVKRLMLGIMLTTMFLSMWISNTATTAMMVPIAEAMLEEIRKGAKKKSAIPLTAVVISSTKSVDDEWPDKTRNHSGGSFKPAPVEDSEMDEDERSERDHLILRKALLLSVAYSANCGGTGTITGSGTNLVLQGLMEELYPTTSTVTFANWMMYNVPGMLLCVVVAWVVLQVVYIRSRDKTDNSTRNAVKTIIEKKYEELGPMTFHEKAVLMFFLILVFLWLFRDPQFVKGWAAVLGSDVKIQDATPAILIALLMFLVPAEPWRLGKSPSLLDWRTVHKKMPWGIVILLGGGFSLAEGTKQSGLSAWVGAQLSDLQLHSPRQTMLLLVLLAALLTEVASNVATASIFLPVVNELALTMRVHPLLLMLPVTIACSFAFMFPVATPPNAIVFETLRLKTWEMMKPGIVMNVLCCGIELIMINTLGTLVFDLNTFPTWAQDTILVPSASTLVASNTTMEIWLSNSTEIDFTQWQ